MLDADVQQNRNTNFVCKPRPRKTELLFTTKMISWVPSFSSLAS